MKAQKLDMTEGPLTRPLIAFILPMINVLHRYMNDFVVVFVGTGELQTKAEEYCHEHGMDDYVRFLGVRSDVNRIYQAIDICVMPSLYEGFPVVGLEVIAAGLPLLLSDRITSELSFGKHVAYLPLDSDVWVETLRQKPFNHHREDGYAEIKNNGYDINDTAIILEKVYMNS